MIIQNFNGHQIRTEIINGDAWFVAKDICEILGLNQVNRAIKTITKDDVTQGIPIPDALNRIQPTTLINESGLYQLIFKSRKQEAIDFQKWVTKELLPETRKAAGLEAFEAFRMLDKQNQIKAHQTIKDNKPNATKWDYVNMNKFCGTATSIVHGKGKKMMKKKEMEETNPEMLITRQKIQDDYTSAYEIHPSHTFAKNVVKMKGKDNYKKGSN